MSGLKQGYSSGVMWVQLLYVTSYLEHFKTAVGQMEVTGRNANQYPPSNAVPVQGMLSYPCHTASHHWPYL
jgi:hypothetical protein